MIVPAILLIVSITVTALAFGIPGLTDLLLISVPSILASLLLLIRAFIQKRKRHADANLRWIVVDGSNIMHWKDGAPAISTVREVINHLSDLGFTSGVVFDANVGYKIGDRYLGDQVLAKSLGLPRNRVMVVPRGTPADPMILTASRDLRAQIVTNDRFRDWVEEYPEISEAGYLVRGGYKTGKLWLDLPAQT